MRDMHGNSSRDDRLKREQQRQEREMAKFKQMYVHAINRSLFWLLLKSYQRGYSCLLVIFFIEDLLSTLNRADTHKQLQQLQNLEEVRADPTPPVPSSATAVADQDQRKVLKFGFSAKGSTTKVFTGFFCLLVQTVL